MERINDITRPSTYYSLVGANGAVLLVARWFDDDAEPCRTNWPDCETVSCWIEIDREEYRDSEHVNEAWKRLKMRNQHLLQRKLAE